MSLTSRMTEAKKRINRVSPYDQAMEEGMLLGREFIAESSVALPSTTGDGKYSLALPDLPDGAQWKVAAVGDAQAKLADCGSASTTTLKLRVGATDIATIDIANSDTNATYVNAASVSGDLLPGGSLVEVDLDAKATGATGPLGLKVKFSVVYTRDLWA